ncbi:hypothetical protein T4A_5809 [Trichinella pseudospiralis]|uniref:Uncharacterized protein n=1 Tax=Trichinella pseudospiralis TaxID=6337 RepID=A0A0V1JR70_TRIPS|nr:hypothetical protein T4A_5809 [Trichinella pseudospiralis]KRZ37464.1 hypothetical protein T4C_7268 [Trichinella pseudospiralis]
MEAVLTSNKQLRDPPVLYIGTAFFCIGDVVIVTILAQAHVSVIFGNLFQHRPEAFTNFRKARPGRWFLLPTVDHCHVSVMDIDAK